MGGDVSVFCMAHYDFVVIGFGFGNLFIMLEMDDW